MGSPDGGGGEAERRFQAELLDRAMTALVAADAAGAVTHWNPYAERLFGWSRAEAVGRRPDQLFLGPAQAALAASIEALVRAGRSWEGEFLARRRDGSAVPVAFGAAPIRGAEGAVAGMVAVAVDLTARRALERQLEHRALHDPLTELPNRTLFMDRLGHALAQADRRDGLVALLFLDLDRFKLVNDGFGHEAGDRVLVAAAKRLIACLRAGDTVARFGGDEFTALLEGVGADEAMRLADRVLAAMRAPFALDGREVFIGTSIGIAFGPDDRTHPGDLLRHADAAMYRAKAAGNGVVAYDPGMDVHALERLGLEADLRRAVERGELRLRYQPIVDLGSGRVVGLEALVRWQHPRAGLLAAKEFVPLAEESGLILPVGRWVLAEACRQAAVWRAERPHGEPVVVSVNVSAREFCQAGMVELVREAMRAAGVGPGQLRLEITERALLEDGDAGLDALGRLKALGVGLAIDDFGTGYSSLGYLRRMPIDAIKIDRVFVAGFGRDAASLAIARAIATLAHDLGMNVTAEGIETAQELAYAGAIACDRGQGVLFAPPLPPAEAGAALARAEPYVFAGGGRPDPRAGWPRRAEPLSALVAHAERLGLAVRAGCDGAGPGAVGPSFATLGDGSPGAA